MALRTTGLLAALLLAASAAAGDGGAAFSLCAALDGRWRLDAPRGPPAATAGAAATAWPSDGGGWLRPAADALGRALLGGPPLGELELAPAAGGGPEPPLRGSWRPGDGGAPLAVAAACRGVHGAQLAVYPAAYRDGDDGGDGGGDGGAAAFAPPECTAAAVAGLEAQRALTAAGAGRQPYVAAHGAAAWDRPLRCAGAAAASLALRRALRRALGANRTAVQVVAADPGHLLLTLAARGGGVVRVVATRLPPRGGGGEDWARTAGYAALLLGVVVLKFGGKWLLRLRGVDPQPWIDALHGRRPAGRPPPGGPGRGAGGRLVGGMTRAEVLAQMARDTEAERLRDRRRS